MQARKPSASITMLMYTRELLDFSMLRKALNLDLNTMRLKWKKKRHIQIGARLIVISRIAV